MKAFPEIDVNVCKSENCISFSLPDRESYIIPSFKLGYPALHCQDCDGNSLLINNEDIKKLLYPYILFFKVTVNGDCPKCFSSSSIRYGMTSKGTARYQCKSCNAVYSPRKVPDSLWKYHSIIELLLSKNTTTEVTNTLNITPATFYRKLQQIDEHLEIRSRLREKALRGERLYGIQTDIVKLTCRDENKTGLANDLLGLVSCCTQTGYVFLTSLNWSDITLDSGSHYSSQGKKVEPTATDDSNNIRSIYKKYENVNERPSFDQIKYTGKICARNVIEPVVMAHYHFQKLQYLLPGKVSHHFLYHDTFIRGACMVAYGPDIRENNCDVFYVIFNESGTQTEYTYKGSYKIGWWDNVWHEYESVSQGKYRYLCHFSRSTVDKTKEYMQINPSLNYTNSFVQAFNQFFPKERVEYLSPKVMSSLLSIFVKYYNYCYLPKNSELTPAQKRGLASEIISIEDLIIKM